MLKKKAVRKKKLKKSANIPKKSNRRGKIENKAPKPSITLRDWPIATCQRDETGIEVPFRLDVTARLPRGLIVNSKKWVIYARA